MTRSSSSPVRVMLQRGSHDARSVRKAPREVVLEALMDKCEAAGLQRGVEFLGVGEEDSLLTPSTL